MPSWVCQWKPFWIPVGESFKKAFLKEWIYISDDSSDEQRVTNFHGLLHSTGNTDYIRDDDPPTPRPSRQPDSLPWEPTRPEDKDYFWERIEAPLPPLRPRCNFIPERLELPLSIEILSGYEDVVSSGTDQLTAWLKMSPHEVLVQYVVDSRKSYSTFSRSIRKETCYIFSHKQCQQTFCYQIGCAEEAQHLELEPWTPTVKRRCLRDKLQEGGISLPCRRRPKMLTTILTNTFHVTHYGGCAVLFKRDTFYPNVEVESIYLHDARRDLLDQVMEGEQGCFLQGVLSCLISSITSERPEVLYSVVSTY